jgi:DNA-binding NarL/FixJ family response regulator
MRCFMRQVSWRSGKGYKQVDIMPIPIEGIHRGARGKRRHASSLVQQRLNGKHSRRYLVQLVNANFGAGDWLLTLTYAPEYLPASFEEACRRMENFIDRLRQQYSDITSGDLRICCLLRMNLSTKEIASLLNVSVRAIELRRYRLRKRLSLDSDTNLIDFLMNY